MNKMVSLEPSYGMGTIPEMQNLAGSKLADYRDMRKDRKIGKNPVTNPLGANTSDAVASFLGNDVPGGKDKRGNMLKMRQAMSTEQTNFNVFDRLLTHSTITSRIKQNPPISQDEQNSASKVRSSSFNLEIEGIDKSDMLWDCDLTVENPHNGPIYSIAFYENQLYTCGKKSLKIWDMDTMSCISDIVAHQGVIKALCVLPEQKLLASACDKVIMLWDMVSLTNVATLKAHHGDINTLRRGNNILVSGGVSGFNNPGLYVWDLRIASPIEERESSDITAIEVYNNDRNVFIGNTSQLVKNIELDGGPSEALSPPHNDVVTSLTNYRGVLVSGSRDKSMRFWDTGSKQLMHKNTASHKSGIT